MNKFKLKLQETGYGFPCMICEHNTDLEKLCRKCAGYNAVTYMAEYDIKALVEKVIQNELLKINE